MRVSVESGATFSTYAFDINMLVLSIVNAEIWICIGFLDSIFSLFVFSNIFLCKIPTVNQQVDKVFGQSEGFGWKTFNDIVDAFGFTQCLICV